MADPISTAAAAIGLAPIALQLGRQLYNTISMLKGIPAELQRLRYDLDTFMKIVSQIQSFCNTHEGSGNLDGMHVLFGTIENRLNSFVQDVAQLQLIVGKLSDKDGMRKNRFGVMVKSVLNKEKIRELSSRLTAHNTTLQLAIITIVGHDGQTIKRNISHIKEGISSLLEGQTSLQNQVVESSARSEGNFSMSRKGRNTLQSPTRNSDQLQPYATGRSGKTTIFLHGSTTDAADSLDAICAEISRILLPSGPASKAAFPRWIALCFKSQLHALLSDILKYESQQLLRNIRNLEDDGKDKGVDDRELPIFLSKSSRSVHQDIAPRRTYLKSLATGFHVEIGLVEANIPAGNISMIFKKESVIVARGIPVVERMVGRIVFIPRHDSSLAGITADFTQYFDGRNEVPRKLSTFGSHPDVSPVFEYLKAGDTPMIRKMLSDRLISPNDRDRSGNSLLWVLLFDYLRFPMQRLMRITILMRKLPRGTEDNTEITEDVLSLIRLLIEYCRSEASSMCLYKRRHTTEHAEAGLFHCVLNRFNCNIRILELVKLILNSGFDLEARDVNGNTPLLYSMYYTSEFQLIEVIDTLIKAGANIHVTNKNGEGCLHLLLRRLSACNNYKMNGEFAGSIVDLLVRLIEQGCDPTLGNVVGYNPVDAALSPTAWPLWCSALVGAKKDIKKILLAIDYSSGIVQFDAEVEEKFAEALKCTSRAVTRPPAEGYTGQHTNGPCYLCRGQSDKRVRQMPFDEFVSPVVEELGFGIHMGLYNHYDNEECLRVQDEDSSHLLDYHPDIMSLDRKRERSLKRHVAYLMWRDGILRTPGDCQRWAAGAEEL